MRIRDLLKRSRRDVFESELDEELTYHVDRVTADLVARGVDPQEARRRAMARFGALDRHRAAMVRIDRRDARRRARLATWERILASVLMAIRRLRRAPGFTLNTVAILGLGIGANAVMFGVVDRLLLRPPLHVADADAVRKVFLHRTFSDGTTSLGQTLTFPDYLDLTDASGLTEVGAWADWGEMVLGRDEEAQEVRVKVATASFFQTLGVAPVQGRFFAPDEDAAGAPPVTILSAEFRERHFGGRDDVLGQVLEVGTGRYEIIGVAPPGFTGADLGHVDVWLPMETAQAIRSEGTGWRDSRSNWWVHVVGRMAPPATDASVGAEITARHRGARRDLIDEGRYSPDATLIPASLIAARGPDPGQESQVATWLAGVSLIVLLIACFNAANLLLARATVAERETALRLAMGAGRRRLIGEVLTESLVLAVLGGSVALVLAAVLSDALHRSLLPGVAFTDTTLGWRVGIFAAAASLFTGVAAGVLPALQSTRADVAEALKSGARGVVSASSRTRLVLLVGQATMSVLLLVGAGLFVKSLKRAQALDLGFDAGAVAVVDLTWTETLPGAERSEVFHRVLERLRSLPQVERAGLTYTVPFRSSLSLGRPRVPGLDSFPRHPSGGPYMNKVGDGYFEAMGLEIVEGRAFDDADGREGAEPLAIVSESMAQALWPGADAVGRCLIFEGGDAAEPVCTRVAGVVENHRRQDLLEDDPHHLYFVNEAHPTFQGPPQALMARLRSTGAGTLALLAREAREVSPLIRFAEAHPLQDHVDPQLRSWRLGASMFTAFGALALVVAAWGLYSVLAFEVARRRREMGIRSALGAGAGRIVGLVVRRSLALGLGGIALGLLLAAAAGRFVEPLLFEVPPTDPAVYLAVAGALLLAAILAGALPAWRATTVQPTEALRAE